MFSNLLLKTPRSIEHKIKKPKIEQIQKRFFIFLLMVLSRFILSSMQTFILYYDGNEVIF